MDWKRETVDNLQRYEARRQSLDSIPERVAMLRNSISSIRSSTSDGTPVKGGGSGRENMLLNNIVEQEELKKSFLAAKRWVAWMDKGLAVLSKEQRLILDRFYIHPEKGAADRLAGELHIVIQTVYKRKDEAVHKLTLALYGQIDS